jgi:hypothetical protein
MRVNVYGEELYPVDDDDGSRVNLRHKQVVAAFQHSCIEILFGKRKIHTAIGREVDDDSSAIKFWYADENQRQMLVSIFQRALEELDKPEARK